MEPTTSPPPNTPGQAPPVRVYIARACDFCKDRHARCDGKEPTCGLCARYKRPCNYNIPRKNRSHRTTNNATPADTLDAETACGLLHELRSAKRNRGAPSPVSSGAPSQFATAFTRSPFSMLLCVQEQQQQQQQQHLHSANPTENAQHSPQHAQSMTIGCEKARQFFSNTAFAVGACNLHQYQACLSFISNAEELLQDSDLMDLANLNVARGLLMLGYTSFLLGRPLKAASYAALVGVQCHSLEKQFSRPIKCCEAVPSELLLAVVSSLRVWATILRILLEENADEAHNMFVQVNSIACNKLEKAALHLQVIRVEAINLLTGRSQNPLRMENLLTAYNLEAASSTECVKHLCCAPQVYSVSFAAFTPLLHALTAVLHYSKKEINLCNASIRQCMNALRLHTNTCQVFGFFCWQAVLLAAKIVSLQGTNNNSPQAALSVADVITVGAGSAFDSPAIVELLEQATVSLDAKQVASSFPSKRRIFVEEDLLAVENQDPDSSELPTPADLFMLNSILQIEPFGQ